MAEKEPKRWYVATYGDLGIDVSFFTTSQRHEYEKRVLDAENDHAGDEIDSYTYGEID